MSQFDHVVRPFKPVRRAPRRRASTHGFAVAIVALPLAAFSAVFLWDGPPASFAMDAAAPTHRAAPGPQTYFAMCGGGPRVNCVVDGDTFWYRGEKIRIADINTPEVSDPGCPREASLGARATERLQDLLNAGTFQLGFDPSGRDTDKYGRKLRTVNRGGASIGDTLVDEGLAERWQGRRSDWC